MISDPLSIYCKWFPALSKELLNSFGNSPAVRLAAEDNEQQHGDKLSGDEICRPPIPFFMDLEITTFCQLKCNYCSRTFLKIVPHHMSLTDVKAILDACPQLVAVNLVGLGETLLHPELSEIIRLLKSKRLRVSLVTNAMALDTQISKMLLENQIDAITFSLDCIDPEVFSRYRQGARVELILDNIRRFMGEKKKLGSKITVNIFCALQQETISHLGQLAEFASAVGIPAIVVSDLNFAQNDKNRMRTSQEFLKLQYYFLQQMRKVAGYGVALLGPNILDKILPEKDWPSCRVTEASQIVHRGAASHQHCLAPWRTLLVRVDGTVNFCNCTPQTVAGKIGDEPFLGIWWHDEYQKFRKELFEGPVPESCRSCPRL